MLIIKTIDSNIEQNIAQHNLDRQTAKVSTLWPTNVRKYEFLTDEDFLSEKILLEKAARNKRLEYSPLGCEIENKLTL